MSPSLRVQAQGQNLLFTGNFSKLQYGCRHEPASISIASRLKSSTRHVLDSRKTHCTRRCNPAITRMGLGPFACRPKCRAHGDGNERKLRLVSARRERQVTTVHLLDNLECTSRAREHNGSRKTSAARARRPPPTSSSLSLAKNCQTHRVRPVKL